MSFTFPDFLQSLCGENEVELTKEAYISSLEALTEGKACYARLWGRAGSGGNWRRWR